VPSISLVQLPYDSGRFDERMGRGPGALIDAGLAECLREKGYDVTVASVRLPEGWHTEGNALVELQRRAVPLIRDAMAEQSRPILLSGNCATAALSVLSALGTRETGVVWFDAHGDFNTPTTSSSGFLDGMALSILTGHCWPKLAERLKDFEAVPESHVIQIGVRNTDPEEEIRLSASQITRLGSSDLSNLPEALEKLEVRQLYVHVDVDAIDPAYGRANSYSCPGGLSLEKLGEALGLIATRTPIAAASVTAYDPAVDRDGRIGRAIPRIVELLAK
jgi:arginase